jgi:hypothetical protein
MLTIMDSSPVCTLLMECHKRPFSHRYSQLNYLKSVLVSAVIACWQDEFACSAVT